MINYIETKLFLLNVLRAVGLRFNDIWQFASIIRDTNEDKPRAIRYTERFVVVEDGTRTIYFDKNKSSTKRWGLYESPVTCFSFATNRGW
jgi:hypothetical protein